jgi:hypothetical protein
MEGDRRADSSFVNFPDDPCKIRLKPEKMESPNLVIRVTRRTKYLIIRLFGHPNPNNRIFGYSVIQLFGYSVIRLFGYLGVGSPE